MTRPLLWPFRVARRAWRAVTPEGARKARDLVLSMCGVFVVVGVLTLLDLADSSRARGVENQETLATLAEVQAKIDAQTSPEAVARQKAMVDAVIETIGCDNRQTIQDLVDLLEERGVLEPGLLEVITAECRALEAERGGG